ncbi:MAG: hypothetical protein U1F46_12585 [Marinagarivorans sp.]
MQQGVPVHYFVCSLEQAHKEVQQQKPCDQWIYDWPNTDYSWLFGNEHPEVTPLPAHSPLARRYYDQVLEDLAHAAGHNLTQCESRRRSQAAPPVPGVTIHVSSQLPNTTRRQPPQDPKGRFSQLSIRFAPEHTPPGPRPCPDLPREVFEEPVDFDWVLFGPGGGNFQWLWQAEQEGAEEILFDFYARPLRFYAGQTNSGTQEPTLGTLTLSMARVAQLSVRFAPRPHPPSTAGRINHNQPLRYQLTTGKGYLNVALVLELEHETSGQFGFIPLGASLAPGQLPAQGEWPTPWDAMSVDSHGLIRHDHAQFIVRVPRPNPAELGLPGWGNFRLRVLLLAYGYDTQPRFVLSNALGTEGDTRMSWKPIGLRHWPSLTAYIPGSTRGIMDPFELLYPVTAILNQAIGFEAVFELHNLTTFRWVVQLTNRLDFTVGLIVQAAGWQAWITLAAGQTRYLSGATAVSGMGNWNAYPLHPFSPLFGWHRNWGNEFIRMLDGECQVSFRVYLTAPDQADCIPPGLPALQAGLRWRANPTDLELSFTPRWSAIKRFSRSGVYEYDFTNADDPILERTPAIRLPAYAILDPATYFAQGYDTAPGDTSPWHKRPWSQALQMPLMCQGEKLSAEGLETLWVAADDIALLIQHEHLTWVAAHLGIAEAVIMDGNDISWFDIGPNNTWHNLLWINRFYTLAGVAVDEAAMRAAFNAMLAHFSDDWPNYYRTLSVHQAVRFGTFLDNGAAEMGTYAINETGNLAEANTLDVNAVSTRFLYRINTFTG